MAITAVNAIVSNVMFMAELNGLLALDPLACIPGRAVNLGRYPEGGKQYEDSAKDAQFCQSIGAVMENLWHAAALLFLITKLRLSVAGKQRT
ncbi:MAG: hypothetical protein ACRD6N_02510 [Pyrinomonadaceae bacterium]